MLSSLDNVTVKNITKGVEVVVPAGNLLRLTDETLLNRKLFSDNDGISVYQHATQGMVTVSFRVPQAGTVQLDVYNMIGSKMMATSRNVGVGKSAFDLRLPMGVYVVRVSGPGYKYSGKLISPSGSSAEKSVVYTGSESSTALSLQSESNVTSLDYTVGDILTYEAVSGIYTSTVTDMPLRDKTIYFDFNTSLKAATSPVMMKVDAPSSVQTSDLISDVEGNEYHTVVIGEQTWMVENLNTTKYANGTKITNVQDKNKWLKLTTEAYCDYENKSTNDKRLGKLYNWYAVTHKNGLAPRGWHVATEAEWNKLRKYVLDNYHRIDNVGVDSKALAAQEGWEKLDLTHYAYNLGINLKTNDSTGFTARPAGFRLKDGTFDDRSGGAFMAAFWTPDENGKIRFISNTCGELFSIDSPKNEGYSVRCLKDHVAETDNPTVSDVTNTTATIQCRITIPGTIKGKINCSFKLFYFEDGYKKKESEIQAVLQNNCYVSKVKDLSPGTKYFVQSYVTNTIGSSYGKVILAFTTMPSVTTDKPTLDSKSQVWNVGGSITNNVGVPIISAGVCWSTKKMPTVADNTTIADVKDSKFSSAIDGMIGGITYYVRAYANNGGHTAYGSEQSFTTSVMDADNNKYTSVVINGQTWLVENLKTTKYSNGSLINCLENDESWNTDTNGAYCNYSNLLANGTKYGRLYNWYAVNSPNGLAPNGWRVATEDDWTTLRSYVETTKKKKLSTTGFKPLQAGMRDNLGVYDYLDLYASWWTSEKTNAAFSKYYISSKYGEVISVIGNNPKSSGLSVRCIQNKIIDVPFEITTITDVSATVKIMSVVDGGLPIISKGVCWSNDKTPTIYDNKVTEGADLKCQLTGLSSGTMYSVRAYIENREGISYGPLKQFKTKEIKDVDGHLYDVVKIGEQTWMTTDLRTTKYRNGDLISKSTALRNDFKSTIGTGVLTALGADFINSESGMYRVDATSTYYNKSAAFDPRGLAPVGWHIATDSDWTELGNYLKVPANDYLYDFLFSGSDLQIDKYILYWIWQEQNPVAYFPGKLFAVVNTESGSIRVRCVKDK
jgi:uncharacterized protein (TIGR02145 family)